MTSLDPGSSCFSLFFRGFNESRGGLRTHSSPPDEGFSAEPEHFLAQNGFVFHHN